MEVLRWSPLAALLSMCLVGSSLPPAAWGQDKGVDAGSQLRAAEHPEKQLLDVNEMTTWMRRDGLFGWDDPRVTLNGTYPKGESVGVVFAQGFVWGGHVRDGQDPALRVGGSTYRSGLRPGKVRQTADGSVTGADDPDNRAAYHVWRVHRDWASLDYTDAAIQFYGVAADDVTAEQRAALRAQYQYDWEHWPAEMGAPYVDVDGDGWYDPDVDVPGEPGADQTLWLVANDLDPDTAAAFHGSPPIGVEHQLTLWGYDDADEMASGALRSVHFARSRLIYVGAAETSQGASIDSMFVAFWAEPDVGYFADDFCGFDTSRGLGYVYNARVTDPAYDTLGLAPPAVGWDLVQGPEGDGESPGSVSTFFCDRSGGSIVNPVIGVYDGTLEWYNFMRGVKPWPHYPEADSFINPQTGEPTRFVLTGDPIDRTGWFDGVELPPGNRSLHMATGPFTMHRGDTVDVVVAQLAALGTSNLSSLGMLYHYDDVAQDLHDERSLPSETDDISGLPETAVIESVFPNPSRGYVHLMLTTASVGRYVVAVYDVLGRRVGSQRVTLASPAQHRVRLDLLDRPAGTYLLVVQSEDGVRSGHRLVTIAP